jgi:hypothetical protein
LARTSRVFPQAEFEIGIAEQERKDLALLPGAQDGQEREGRLRPPRRHSPRVLACRLTCTDEIFGKRTASPARSVQPAGLVR